MGSYNLTCMITGIGIAENAECAVVPLRRGIKTWTSENLANLLLQDLGDEETFLMPDGLVFMCKYDGYGTYTSIEEYEEYNELVAKRFFGKPDDVLIDDFFVKIQREIDGNRHFNLIPIHMSAYKSIIKEHINSKNDHWGKVVDDFLIDYDEEGLINKRLFEDFEGFDKFSKLLNAVYDDLYIDSLSEEQIKELSEKERMEYLIHMNFIGHEISSRATSKELIKKIIEYSNGIDERMIFESLTLFHYIKNSRLGWIPVFGAGKQKSSIDDTIVNIHAAQSAVINELKSDLAWEFGDRTPDLNQIKYNENREFLDSAFSKYLPKEKFTNNAFLKSNNFNKFIDSLSFEEKVSILTELKSNI